MSEARSGNPDPDNDTSSQATGLHALETPVVPRRSLILVRRLLMLVAIPALAVAAGLAVYVNTGRLVSTENAYIKSHIVNISAEVSGTIVAVPVEENQRVEKGDVLFRLDDAPFKLAVNQASARLAQVESELARDKLAYRAAVSEIALYQSTVDYAATQLARQQGLVDASLGRQEDLDTALYELNNARRRVTVASEKAETLLAVLRGDPDIQAAAHPAWQVARAQLEQAELDLKRAVVRAPFNGVVTNRPEPGDYVDRGALITAVVADQDMWVEANFKETQMTRIREGQPVQFEIDAYPGTRWQGAVDSISRTTGAEFALLPPQNATGNWVKIVQRVPVRIRIEDSHEQFELRAGMSCSVTVDTGYQRHWRDLLPGR
ncbi:MAG: HlyD family secretion protein [Proteobacteria bacterium]|nr:HlyD family secretion protein [Pseudomonadota bacterium]